MIYHPSLGITSNKPEKSELGTAIPPAPLADEGKEGWIGKFNENFIYTDFRGYVIRPEIVEELKSFISQLLEEARLQEFQDGEQAEMDNTKNKLPKLIAQSRQEAIKSERERCVKLLKECLMQCPIHELMTTFCQDCTEAVGANQMLREAIKAIKEEGK